MISRRGWRFAPCFLLVFALSTLIRVPFADAQAGPDTVVPAPRDGGWFEMHKQFLDRGAAHNIKTLGDVDLLFLGDSITQGWRGAPSVWNRHYGPRHAANFGIGGDRTQHVLWRIQNGELEHIHPKVVVLMIGTNNVGSNGPEEIAQGVTTIVENLRKQLPKSKILLLGVFPRDPQPASPRRERLKLVNERISKLDDGSNIRYLDIGKAFLQADGTLTKEVMPDYLHLSGKGYQIWADAMEPMLWSMLDEQK
jgi:lysophospholipase L1-like esterase